MIALVAAVLFAQVSATISIGSKPDTTAAAKKAAQSDSAFERRQARRDSLRAHRQERDSLQHARRLERRLTVTDAVLKSAFKDPGARDLLLRARAARLEQDSTLDGYEAHSYARMSVGMGFSKLGRDRLLIRTERATHIQWQRGKGAVIDVKGARSAFPMLDGLGNADMHGGDADDGEITDLPYYPGRETLWIGSDLAKPDVADDVIIHPLATGAEAYYTYASGGKVGFLLPGGKHIELRELLVRPRKPEWNVAVGSLWFDDSTARLVRAVYRLAQEMDIMAIARQESEDEHDPDDDIPRWVKPMITPMRASVSAITVEYGLHEGKFWLPRSEVMEADAQVSFMHVPVKLEQHFTYDAVNESFSTPMPDFTTPVADTARDSVSRATRHERERNECKMGTERVQRTTSHDKVQMIVRIPCDTVALARSPDLPKSIYDDGEEVFGSVERDALISEALSLNAQASFAPQAPKITYGLPYTRFNRIEGLSTAVAVDQVLGRGYTTHALLRLGAADLSPNAELSLDRTDGRRTIGVGIYRRLVASNDWGDPLGFSSSLSALFFGRDEGFYYRTWGAELTGVKQHGVFSSWRLFAEQQFDATVHTEFSLAHPGGVKGDLSNIDAVNGKVVGLALMQHSSVGLDPHGFRALTDFKAEAAAGSFDYSKGSLQTTLSHRLTHGIDGALTVGGGTSGGHLPIQKQFFLGGVQTVRGQRAGAAIGDSFWMSSVELGTSKVGAREIVFGDLGWAGNRNDFAHPGRPLSGAGVGASFMDGLIRFDVAKGIYPEKSIRTNLYLEARF